MVLIITSQANKSFASKVADDYDHVEYASPKFPGIRYDAEKVIIIGNHSDIQRRYRGIVSVEVIEPPTKDTENESNE